MMLRLIAVARPSPPRGEGEGGSLSRAIALALFGALLAGLVTLPDEAQATC